MSTAAADAGTKDTNRKVIFKSYGSFTSFIKRINNTQIDYAQYTNIIMPIYDLIEQNDNYLKTHGMLFQYFRGVPAADNDDKITDFSYTNVTDSFNLSWQWYKKCWNNGTVKISKQFLKHPWNTFK